MKHDPTTCPTCAPALTAAGRRGTARAQQAVRHATGEPADPRQLLEDTRC